jgi:hypothetical protein
MQDARAERERICDEYDRRNRKGAYAEDSDTPDTPSEEETGSFADRSAAARARVLAIPEPEPEQDVEDGRPVAFRAMDSFIDKHPEYAKESGYNRVANTALTSQHDDIIRLRDKFNRTNNKADGEALFARSAEVAEIAAEKAAQRAVIEREGLRRLSLQHG